MRAHLLGLSSAVVFLSCNTEHGAGGGVPLTGTSAVANTAPTVSQWSSNVAQGRAPLALRLSWEFLDAEGDALACRVLDGEAEIAPWRDCENKGVFETTLTSSGKHALVMEVRDGALGLGQATTSVNVLPRAEGDVRIAKVEFGQTVLSENLRLIAGKEALLRVFLLGDRVGIPAVSVFVVAQRDGQKIGELKLDGPATVPTEPVLSDLKQQWTGKLPSDWIAPGLLLRVVADPEDALAETDDTNNIRDISPSVGKATQLPVTGVPIVQQGLTGRPSDLSGLMTRLWPLHSVDQQNRAPFTFGKAITSGGGGWSELLGQLLSIRKTDNARRNYFAFIRVNFGGGVAGMGYVGLPSAAARDDSPSTFAHEMGHNLGREHAPCGGADGADAKYPYAGAKIGSWGYDSLSKQLMSPNRYFDIMSYCDPQWVSDYNYGQVQSFLEKYYGQSSGAAIPSASYLVHGSIGADGTVALAPTFALTAHRFEDDAVAGAEGSLRLKATFKSGAVRDIPFDAYRLADAIEEVSNFAVLVPREGELAALDIVRDGHSVWARRVAGTQGADPDVRLREVGGALEVRWNAQAFPYLALAHLGEGRTTLALGLEGGRAVLPVGALPAGGQWNVSVSNGLATTDFVTDR